MPLCPHGMNPAACPMCFKAKPPPTRAPGATARSDIPTGPVVPIGEATVRATQTAAALARLGRGTDAGPGLKPPHEETPAAPSPEAYSNEALWEPPAHPQLIDRLPRHPHADASKVTVLKGR